MNLDAIRHVNAIRRGEVKPSKGEKEAMDTIERIMARAAEKPKKPEKK